MGLAWEAMVFRSSDFQTTCWTQVLGAAHGLSGNVDARQSLETLCQRYWYPLYAFLRREGYDANTAEDHVQGFFADLLNRKSLQAADPERGRFRSFLLTACRNFVSNQERRQRAEKRGGGKAILPLETKTGEQRYLCEPVDDWSPESLFDRQWALESIDAAMRLLEDQHIAQGRGEKFRQLKPLLAPADDRETYASVGERLGMTEAAVKVAVHRLRQQFAAALRDVVAATVNWEQLGERHIDAELAELLRALSGEQRRDG